MHHRKHMASRTTLLFGALPLALMLSGCFDGSSSSSSRPQVQTGTFVDSPVAGLDYEGDRTRASRTDEAGRFEYRRGEALRFAIGELELGSATGAEVLTPLSITADATDAQDQRVTNKLILLQTLDADGDLNNGIQITDAIRSRVSAQAADIRFDQPPEQFRDSIAELIAALEADGAFTDTDPRPRSIRGIDQARAHFARSTSPRHTVSTTYGEVRGFEANERTWQFLGIPYAKPPIGELRWREPEPPESWSGVREAVAWADQSAQDMALERINEGGMSEDSLYLNVTAPKDAENLPVMVWFHGGAFAILSANSRQYNNPEGLTDRGVVLVTVNHRLGPFGYLAHPLLSAESGYGGSGNYGQMDLVMALKWVKDNIAAFGGDPGNVTLFGQSGGGGKAYSLLNSPQASGLFHKAIVQSAFAPLDEDTTPAASLSSAEAIGEAIFARAGVSTLEEARALPWTAIVQAESSNGITRQLYRPNVDHYYQPQTYFDNARNGMPSDVPLMAGVTSGDSINHRESLPVWLRQRTEDYQSGQYVYKFSQVPDGWVQLGLQSCHGCELPYLFNHPEGMVQNFQLGLVLTPEGRRPTIGDLNGNGVSGSQGDTEDIFLSMEWGSEDDAIAEVMMQMWTNFARTGDPALEEFDWPEYDLAGDTFVEIGPQGELTVKTGLEAAME
ncbi:para-nitrobenzyl esterase [Halopseudomonas formosensis]|uniref:Carboxylic ester hydrolase n=1 Tax=Halopseudomonas formosensis TaxID=1002526 RepID=A0A1I6A132_9GAMM|nr:carboxylesterase family protein [Halopseudomonas formosensis]SFQ62382.1 para-nitrobenzyl esterase [Halopseudomonas formosensis]